MKPHPPDRAALIATAIVLSACSGTGEAGASAEVARRDSAGVEVVENFGTVGRESGWTISPEPVFRVGWRDDDPQFGTLGAGSIAPDGSVVVGDLMASEVHLIEPRGRAVRRLGGAGEGPGEFGQVFRILRLPADSFLVVHGTDSRLSIFEGVHFLEERRPPVMTGQQSAPAMRTAEGGFILTPSVIPYSREADAEGWSWSPVFFSENLENADTLAMLPALEILAPGDDNPVRHRGLVVATPAGIVSLRTSRPEATWIDLAGRTTRIARWDAAVDEVDDDDWADIVHVVGAAPAAPSGDQREQMLDRWRDDFGGTRPLFGDAKVDPFGNIWLGLDGVFATESGRYHVLGAGGVWIGSVQLPAPGRLLDVTESHVLLVERNDLEMESVALYELRRAGS